MWSALATIARVEGGASLYRGLVPNLLSAAPYSGGVLIPTCRNSKI